jgi:hypothetical protein
MSLQITLATPQTIVKQPEITETITEIVIERIVDIPSIKKVFVFVRGERIELAQLSGDNYDTPNEWTNSDVIDAVKAHYGIA